MVRPGRLVPHIRRSPFRLTRSWCWILVASLVMVVALAGSVDAKSTKKPCKPTLADCPDEGCGLQFDPNLNRRKNIRSDNQTPTLRTLSWVKALHDPDNSAEGDSREELDSLGEGQAISVVAYLLVAKPELDGESCNCGLHTPAETDNHLVLVTKTPPPPREGIGDGGVHAPGPTQPPQLHPRDDPATDRRHAREGPACARQRPVDV